MNAVRHLEDFDDAAFDPFVADEAMFGHCPDPYGPLAELRRQGPVHALNYRVFMGEPPDITSSDVDHFTVVGYDEVNQALREVETFSNRAYLRNIGISFGRSVSTMDAPEHPRFRKIFQKAFLPNVVSKWGESVVDPVIDSLMAGFEKRGTADLVQEFTFHYPFQIVYRQLGLPPDEVKTFHKLAMAQILVSVDVAHGTEASRKLGTYFDALIEERRRNPGSDLVSVLAQAEVEGERLPQDVLISFLRQLVNAGGDTTYRGTSVLLTGLLSNPDQLEAVRQNRALVPQAIEEALRWDGPVLIQTRMALRDAELGGVKIPRGAFLDVAAGAANRDPQRFPDPDTFNILRKPEHRHFAFAFGPHVCIGQHLARVEMTRALHAVLDRLPRVRLDPDRPAPQIRGIMMRVPKHIFVRFG
ncbi:MAG TPA: cytochrome P450 [Steroidobacteraceae bacterium]|nr:cytochrome P450 [Steroidobacteraceae bacterium]